MPDHYKHAPLLHIGYRANLIAVGQTVWRMSVHIRRKNWALASRLSRSLKVIGTDTEGSATYDFLLTFIVTMGYVRIFSKIANFSERLFNAPTERVPVGIMQCLGLKTIMMALPETTASTTVKKQR